MVSMFKAQLMIDWEELKMSPSMANTKNSEIEKRLYKLWKKQGSQALRRKYVVLRNTLTISLRSAKKHFFKTLNTSDQKLFWKTVLC